MDTQKPTSTQGVPHPPVAQAGRRRPASPDELLWGPALLRAVEGGDAAKVLGIIRAWPKAAGARKPDGASMLHLAAARGLVNVAEVLLQYKAALDSKDQNKATPLHLAALGGPASLIRLLLLHGAAINAIDAAKQTPLDMAVQGQQKQNIALLREHGAVRGANLVDFAGRAALHRAAARADAGQVGQLLQRGAHVNVQDRQGWTPLHAAAASGCNQAVVLLIKAGAEVDARTGDGSTPLHLAARAGHCRVVWQLLEAGAAVNVRQGTDEDSQPSLFPEGATPLHLAARAGSCKLVELLLMKGNADRNLRDTTGRTALHIAAETGRWGMCCDLLDHSEGLQAIKTHTGWTALDLAIAAGHTDIVRLLDWRQDYRELAEPPPDLLANLKALSAKVDGDCGAEELSDAHKATLAVLADLVARVEHLERLSRQAARRAKPRGVGPGKKPGAATQPLPKPATPASPQGRSLRVKLIAHLGEMLESLSYGNTDGVKDDLAFAGLMLAGGPVTDDEGVPFSEYLKDIAPVLCTELLATFKLTFMVLNSDKPGADKEATALIKAALEKLTGYVETKERIEAEDHGGGHDKPATDGTQQEATAARPSLKAAVATLLQSFSDNLYDYPGEAKGDLYSAKAILSGETPNDPQGVPYSSYVQDIPPEFRVEAAAVLDKALNGLYGRIGPEAWDAASSLVAPIRRQLQGVPEVE